MSRRAFTGSADQNGDLTSILAFKWLGLDPFLYVFPVEIYDNYIEYILYTFIYVLYIYNIDVICMIPMWKDRESHVYI